MASYSISDDLPPTDGVSTPPPLQIVWAAWWEGWMATYSISDDFLPTDGIRSPLLLR